MLGRLYSAAQKPILSDMRRFLIAVGTTTTLLLTGYLPAFILTYGTYAAIGITLTAMLAVLELSKRTKLLPYVISLLIAIALPLLLTFLIGLVMAPITGILLSTATFAGLLVTNQLVHYLSTDKKGVFFAFVASTALVLGGGFASYPILAPIFMYGAVSAIPIFTASLYLMYGASKLAADIAIQILPIATSNTFFVIETTANLVFDAMYLLAKMPFDLLQRYQSKEQSATKPATPMPNIQDELNIDSSYQSSDEEDLNDPPANKTINYEAYYRLSGPPPLKPTTNRPLACNSLKP